MIRGQKPSGSSVIKWEVGQYVAEFVRLFRIWDLYMREREREEREE